MKFVFLFYYFKQHYSKSKFPDLLKPFFALLKNFQTRIAVVFRTSLEVAYKCPESFHRETFGDKLGKRRQGKRGKNVKYRGKWRKMEKWSSEGGIWGKNEKGKEENQKFKGKNYVK